MKKEFCYRLNDSYYDLDIKGKRLIDEIVRFCKNNNRFPSESDMRSKDGYISKSRYWSYFDKDAWTKVKNYIEPIGEEKPEHYTCHKCGIEKEFNSNNFRKDKASKFGFKKICNDCNNANNYNNTLIKLANKYRIQGDLYNPINWYEIFVNNNDVDQMPMFCYSEENMIKVIRYIFLTKLNISSEYGLLSNYSDDTFEKYRVRMIIQKLGGKQKSFNKCFPEIEVVFDSKRRKYSNPIIVDEIIDRWMKEYNVTIYDLIKSGISNKFDNEIKSLMMQFGSKNNVFEGFCKRKNIKHPVYGRDMLFWDFGDMPLGYWKDKENRINRIKYYCEIECEEPIMNVFENTTLLKIWIEKYFKRLDIAKIVPYCPKGFGIYDILIECYPTICKNKVLFEWEWTQCNKNDKQFLINSLRELILYRMNDIIINPLIDIPKYINGSYMTEILPKFQKHISKKRFESYYEWCCLAFPEYAENWTIQEFDSLVAYDGAKCGSKQEMMVYEFIKRDLKLEYIKCIGSKRSGKYVFKLPEEYEYEKFCPDFVIEYIEKDGKKIKLDKPIYLEYFGMYAEGNKHEIFINYKKKTEYKCQYYNSRDDIHFIPIYPNDIKNNFENLVEKLGSFYLQNFNINLKEAI